MQNRRIWTIKENYVDHFTVILVIHSFFFYFLKYIFALYNLPIIKLKKMDMQLIALKNSE
jgi:hypothetical protein